jgi:ribose-phosphate pyrophosphokinase
VLLDKFKGGETRVEIEESVRGKDVFIIQSGGGKGTKPPWRIVLAIVVLS